MLQDRGSSRCWIGLASGMVATAACAFEEGALLEDFLAPQFLELSVVPNPARTGDEVLISFEVSEPLSSPASATVAGTPAESVGGSPEEPSVYRFRYRVQAGDLGGATQKILPLVLRAVDLGGRVGERVLDLVIDEQPPQVTAEDVQPPTATAGVPLALTLTANEALAELAATVAGRPATVLDQSDDGVVWFLGYTPVGDESEGSVPIRWTLTDLARNQATAETSVILDFTPPQITGLSADRNFAGSGESVTIGFGVDGTSQAPEVTVGTQPATQVTSDYTFSYTVTESDPEGRTPIVVRVSDEAGNQGRGELSFVVDRGLPTFTNITLQPQPARAAAPLHIRFVASEPLLSATVLVGVRVASLAWQHNLEYDFVYEPDGTEGAQATVSISGTDTRNQPNSVDTTALFDFATPTLTVTPSRTSAQGGETLTLTVQASEALVSAPKVTVDGLAAVPEQVAGSPYTFRYDISGDESNGPVTVLAWGVDAAGNVGRAEAQVTLNTAPRVLGRYPGAGAVGIAASDTVRATFSEPMDAATVLGAFTVRADGAPVAGTVAYRESDWTAVFTPAAPWSFDAVVQVEVSSSARDLTGLALRSNNDWSFTAAGVGPTIAGRVEVPSGWIQPRVIDVASGSLATPDATGAFALALAEARSDHRLVAFDDVNQNGTLDVSESRVGYFDCATHRDVLDTRQGSLRGVLLRSFALSGQVEIPGDWATPRVTETRWRNSVAPNADGSYLLTVTPADFSGQLFLFDDENKDGRLDGLESQLPFRAPADLCGPDPVLPFNLHLRTLQGTVRDVPQSWAVQVVALMAPPYDAIVVARAEPDLLGRYHLTVSDADLVVMAFDDSNGNAFWDPRTEARIPAVSDGVAADLRDRHAVDVIGRELAGIFTPPSGWLRPRVGTMGSPNAPAPVFYGSVPAGTTAYTLFSGAQGNLHVVAFDDTDEDGLLGANEPALFYEANPVDTRAADRSGIDIATVELIGTVPADPPWPQRRLLVVQGHNRVYADAVDALSVPVGRAAGGEVYVFDDTNADGLWQSEEPRFQVAGPFDTSNATGPFAVTLQVCSISGQFAPPPIWSNASVWAASTAGQSPGLVTTDYIAYGPATTLDLSLFDDRNNNRRPDPGEPRLLADRVSNVGCNAAPTRLAGYPIRGSVTLPPTWGRPRVAFDPAPYNTTIPDALGEYTLYGGLEGPGTVRMFDDLNGSGAYEPGEPTVERAVAVNPVAEPVLVAVETEAISGRLVTPPPWSAPHVRAGEAIARPEADGRFIVFGPKSPTVPLRMFEDRSGDGRPQGPILEPTIAWTGPDISTQLGPVTGRVLTHVTVSGQAVWPPFWRQPRVTVENKDVAVPGTDGGYLLYVERSLHTLILFDDRDQDGRVDVSEPQLPATAVADATEGSVSGVNLGFAVVAGTADSPVDWYRPRVQAATDVAPLADDGTFTVTTRRADNVAVVLFDDRNGNDRADAVEPILEAVGSPLSTATSNVLDVRITHARVAGTIAPPDAWRWPYVAVQGQPYGAVAQGGVFSFAVPEAVVQLWMFDDFNGNGLRDAYEQAFVLCDGLNPVDVDTRQGYVTGLTIDTGCGG